MFFKKPKSSNNSNSSKDKNAKKFIFILNDGGKDSFSLNSKEKLDRMEELCISEALLVCRFRNGAVDTLIATIPKDWSAEIRYQTNKVLLKEMNL